MRNEMEWLMGIMFEASLFACISIGTCGLLLAAIWLQVYAINRLVQCLKLNRICVQFIWAVVQRKLRGGEALNVAIDRVANRRAEELRQSKEVEL